MAETKLSFKVVDLLQAFGEIVLEKSDSWLHWGLALSEFLSCRLLVCEQREKALDHRLAITRLIKHCVFVLILLNARL